MLQKFLLTKAFLRGLNETADIRKSWSTMYILMADGGSGWGDTATALKERPHLLTFHWLDLVTWPLTARELENVSIPGKHDLNQGILLRKKKQKKILDRQGSLSCTSC